MKKGLTIILIIFAFVVFSSNTQAQYYWWPQQLLIPIQENSANVNLTGEGYVWERQIDSATTAIFSQSTSGGNTNPVCLVSVPGMKFIHPVLWHGYLSNFVVFEANINGSSDIYEIMLDNFGNPVGEMLPLITGPANDHDFCFESDWPVRMAWLADETLKVATFNQDNNQLILSNIATIDSTSCSSPAVYYYPQSLMWIKHSDTMDYIRISNPNAVGWTVPVNYDSASQIVSLQTSLDYYPLTFWTYTNDTSWFMKDHFPNPAQPYSIIPDVEQNHPFEFDVCNIGYGVKKKSGFVDGNFFQAYIQRFDGHDEVFLNQDYDINTYYNFSESGTNCRNPQFFVGEYAAPSTFFFYLTWEAFVDSSWQIYYSKTPITWGGIEENENSMISNLLVSPNPFSEALHISFDLEKPANITIDLLDIHGRLLTNLASEKYTEANFSRLFKILEIQMVTGPCFVRIKVGESYSFIKVISVR